MSCLGDHLNLETVNRRKGIRPTCSEVLLKPVF